MAKNHLSNSQIKMFNEGTTGCQKLPVSVTKHPSAREKKPLVPRGSDRVASYRGSKSLTQKERHRKLCRTPRASIDLGPIQTIMWKDFPRWNWMEFVFLHCQQAGETLRLQFQGKFTIFESSTHFCSPYKFCIKLLLKCSLGDYMFPGIFEINYIRGKQSVLWWSIRK